MIYFKINNNTKRDMAKLFKKAVVLLTPYFGLVEKRMYPIKVVINPKQFKRDRSTIEQTGYMALKVFDDESKQSDADIVWLICHEFAHIIQSNNAEIEKTSLKLEDNALRLVFMKMFGMNEEQVIEIFHDFLPAEVYANAFATTLVGHFYKRHPFSVPQKFLQNKGISV